MKTLRFDACIVEIHDSGHVRTLFKDGSLVDAWPNFRQRDRGLAASLGYSTIEAMNAEHDPLHAFLAEKMGLPFSPALYSVAHDEEGLVLAFQKYLNLHQITKPLQQFSKLKLYKLAKTAKELLR